MGFVLILDSAMSRYSRGPSSSEKVSNRGGGKAPNSVPGAIWRRTSASRRVAGSLNRTSAIRLTPKRLAMLKLLASQATISVDHARLYSELKQENSDRRKAEETLRERRTAVAGYSRQQHRGHFRQGSQTPLHFGQPRI